MMVNIQLEDTLTVLYLVLRLRRFSQYATLADSYWPWLKLFLGENRSHGT